MDMKNRTTITAIGSYVPERVLSNLDLEQLVDTSSEWIVQRTGIRERRIAAKEEYTSHLCIEAINDLLRRYPAALDDVDMILTATYTPDFPAPSVSCQIQNHFGMTTAAALDVNAACAGFVYALQLANAWISSGAGQKVLVLGADTASKIVDYSDRSTCVLFGDGAGAVLVERAMEESAGGILESNLGAEGSGGIHLYRSGLSNMLHGRPLDGNGMLVQNGREVYRFAVGTVPNGIRSLLNKLQWSVEDIDWFIPHSANLRIIEAICTRTGIPLERALHSIEYYGNTSAATIPLSLHQGVKQGKVAAGDRLLLYGFGGGFAYGGVIMEWTLQPAASVPCEYAEAGAAG